MTAGQEAVFFELHTGLPREGPGDPQSTRRAFACLRALPERPRNLDLGCGPGARTLEVLAGKRREIELYRKYCAFYGYVFCVARVRSEQA